MEEGSKCLEDGCDGAMEYPPVENCSCHINPPCGACTGQRLTCTDCGAQEERYDPPAVVYEAPLAPIMRYKQETDLGDGKRLFDCRYDGSSGSTMVWTGRYEGNVTSADIMKAFGDGTFGHRGPSIYGGHFKYTLITD